MQSAQVVYLCKALLLWLNASLGFHMQFTEDIYLRVNQTTQQNTTQDNKTFICKLSRRQDKRQGARVQTKPCRSCSSLTAGPKGWVCIKDTMFKIQFYSFHYALDFLWWPDWVRDECTQGQGRRDGPVAGNGTHQYVKWGWPSRPPDWFKLWRGGACHLGGSRVLGRHQHPPPMHSNICLIATQYCSSAMLCYAVVSAAWQEAVNWIFACQCAWLASVPPPPAIIHHSTITSIARKYQQIPVIMTLRHYCRYLKEPWNQNMVWSGLDGFYWI